MKPEITPLQLATLAAHIGIKDPEMAVLHAWSLLRAANETLESFEERKKYLKDFEGQLYEASPEEFKAWVEGFKGPAFHVYGYLEGVTVRTEQGTGGSFSPTQVLL